MLTTEHTATARRVSRNTRKAYITKSALQDRNSFWGPSCEVPGCTFRVPAALCHASGGPMHLHHMHALSDGGEDVRENCILLCPNHHALAHAVTFGDPDSTQGFRARPADPDGPYAAARIYLLRDIALLETDPQRFVTSTLEALIQVRAAQGLKPLRTAIGSAAKVLERWGVDVPATWGM